MPFLPPVWPSRNCRLSSHGLERAGSRERAATAQAAAATTLRGPGAAMASHGRRTGSAARAAATTTSSEPGAAIAWRRHEHGGQSRRRPAAGTKPLEPANWSSRN
ncbi:uncharacterized protein LOC123407373 [Hordeum vulgare subsp. vulgare]|uniref:uncharacterized protein LOC123407373 n=1 Tax=Hordeum vulgare subsp. vulgare TaxID=112509 RepID=UPI001D1A33BC|nr:uncharacterized protein LOC123407373 [Hordeum vulgare subsp. vulgare]